MSCQERDLLRNEHAEAGAAFDAARQVLQDRMGVSPKSEFLVLNQATEKAWANLQRAHQALDAHIRSHDCEAV